jgi:hypothetical protein
MMAKISRNIVVLAVVAFCALFLTGHPLGPTAEAQPEQAQPVEDPYEDATVLVEAFVVEVKLSALYDLGVSPIGEKPNSVSVEDVLKCLKDKDNAQVTAGAKVNTAQRQEGQTKSTQIRRFEREQVVQPARGDRGPVSSKVSQSYEVGTQFAVTTFIKPDRRIGAHFVFTQSTLDLFPRQDGEPESVTREWQGTALLEADRPSIVGATQSEQETVFLILCAHIKSE